MDFNDMSNAKRQEAILRGYYQCFGLDRDDVGYVKPSTPSIQSASFVTVPLRDIDPDAYDKIDKSPSGLEGVTEVDDFRDCPARIFDDIERLNCAGEHHPGTLEDSSKFDVDTFPGVGIRVCSALKQLGLIPKEMHGQAVGVGELAIEGRFHRVLMICGVFTPGI